LVHYEKAKFDAQFIAELLLQNIITTLELNLVVDTFDISLIILISEHKLAKD